MELLEKQIRAYPFLVRRNVASVCVQDVFKWVGGAEGEGLEYMAAALRLCLCKGQYRDSYGLAFSSQIHAYFSQRGLSFGKNRTFAD